MSQLNINMSAQFEADLTSFMRLRGIRSKSEAVRVAIREGLERSSPPPAGGSFRSWLGLAGPPDSQTPESPLTEDELWSSTRR